MMIARAALLLLLGLAAPLAAQEPEPGDDAAAAAAAAEGPAAQAKARTPDMAEDPRARLSALFEMLAASTESEAEGVERRIVELLSDSGSDSMDLLLSRGREALDDEAYDKAVDHLDALTRLAPDFAEGWNARATAHFLQDQLWLAVADIQKALALEPRHFAALVGLSVILERLGDESGALRAARAALAINPHIEEARETEKRLGPKIDGRDI